MMTLGEMWNLLTGTARHQAEQANERAYRTLDRKLCEGIDELDDIDALMKGGKSNGHDKPASR